MKSKLQYLVQGILVMLFLVFNIICWSCIIEGYTVPRIVAFISIITSCWMTAKIIYTWERNLEGETNDSLSD